MTTLLLDTHVLVWALTSTAKLSRRAADGLTNEANRVLVSAVSAYEIEFKRDRSEELGRAPPDLIETTQSMGFEWIDLTPGHCLAAGRLPRLHGDPFDRLLAAQALAENVSLVTADRQIRAYGVPTLW
jgi:PIN domain nuclease of toxin-antitoxin system